MSLGVVTVFGGTGFLGRRVVRHLREHEFSVRIASRRPGRGWELFGSDDPQLQSVKADIHDERTVAGALAGASGAVNAVSLYVEHGRQTFHSVHVEGASRVAVQARRAGVEGLVHISGIGADPASPSLYIRTRGEGELAVRAAFPAAILLRPAVMFGPDDAFLTTILALLRRLPLYPMFGHGRTRLQPAYVGDVAEAIARVLRRTQAHAVTFECGGPRVYSYEELLGVVARSAGLGRILVPLPFPAWRALSWIAEVLPHPPITRNQVELMQIDNIASPAMPGFADLDIVPRSLEDMLEQLLRDRPETSPRSRLTAERSSAARATPLSRRGNLLRDLGMDMRLEVAVYGIAVPWLPPAAGGTRRYVAPTPLGAHVTAGDHSGKRAQTVHWLHQLGARA